MIATSGIRGIQVRGHGEESAGDPCGRGCSDRLDAALPLRLPVLDARRRSRPSCAAGVAQLTLQTVPSYGHSPDPDWVSYLGAGLERAMGAHDDLQGAGEHARARDRLPVRHRDGIAQPVPRAGPRDARGRRHLNGKPFSRRSTRTTRRTPSRFPISGSASRCPGSATARPTSAAPRPARSATRTRRSPSRSGRPPREPTAGSASFRAPPASSTATAARCRRSAG